MELERRIRRLERMNAVLGVVPTSDDGAAAPSDETPAAPARREPDTALPNSLSTRSDYRDIRTHAKGGLGEVLVGEDARLHRPVAIKRMRAPHDRDPERRRRFLWEAEITSRLEHPGIVPVHGVGEDADGRPCYSMRFVQGDSLAAAIEKFHETDRAGRDAGERSLALRQLLGRFVTVCNTIAYAHSQGVIHRDIKPANVMLGPYGETLVVDWGLAKLIGATGPDSDLGDATLPYSPGDGGFGSDMGTKIGSALGTPAFMSPEQAAGRWSEVGPTSDIYSLGATLYALLAGRSPFKGKHVGEMLGRVERGSFPKPRDVKPNVSQPLEAICLKAMATLPEHRYATALDVAADIEHWLADEPVIAWPEPWSQRLRRWLGRHRAVVTSAATITLMAVVSLAFATLFLARANEAERKAAADMREQHAETEAALERAEQSFQQARQAVDDYFITVSQSKLKSVPGVQAIHRELLMNALKYYQEFLKQRAADPTNRVNVAGTLSKVAQIVADIESIHAALAWHDKAIAAWRELVRENPAKAEYQRQLAESLDRYGTHLRRAGRMPDALEAEKESVAILDQVFQADPSDEQAERLLARAYTSLALIQGTMGNQEDAIRTGRQSLAIRERLSSSHPADRALRLQNSIVYNNMGCDLADLGRHTEALQTLDRALELEEKLIEEEQADPKLRDNSLASAGASGHLAGTYINIANSLSCLSRFKDALGYFEKARDAYRQLVQEQPTAFLHRVELAQALSSLADTRLVADGSAEDALRDAEQARDLCAQLVLDDPAQVNHVSLLGNCWDSIGEALAKLQRRDDAAEAFRHGIEHHQQAVAKSPDLFNARLRLATHYLAVAYAHREWLEPSEAARAIQQARDLFPNDRWVLYRVAAALAQCISLVGDGKSDLNAAEQVKRQKYADDAMQALEQAVSLGFNESEPLKTATAFDPLRHRDDFRQLVQRIEADLSK